MSRNYTVIDNTELHRFEIHEAGHTAFENYTLFDGGIAYTHTEVPPELGGRGIASFLIRYILDDAAAKGLTVNPVCLLVKAYIDKYPEYHLRPLQNPICGAFLCCALLRLELHPHLGVL